MRAARSDEQVFDLLQLTAGRVLFGRLAHLLVSEVAIRQDRLGGGAGVQHDAVAAAEGADPRERGGGREAQGPPAVRPRDVDAVGEVADRRSCHRDAGGHPALSRLWTPV